jgi:hypothetical protein
MLQNGKQFNFIGWKSTFVVFVEIIIPRKKLVDQESQIYQEQPLTNINTTNLNVNEHKFTTIAGELTPTNNQ